MLRDELPILRRMCGAAAPGAATDGRSSLTTYARALRVASLTWWKLPMAVISSGDVIGLCHQIKNLLGRGDMQGLPAVNFA